MDEQKARALLELAADAEAPPTRVDIELARSRGRTRLRWRQACLVGAPVLVVVALSLATAVPFAGGGAAASRRTVLAASGRVMPPRQFNPLIPYVAFGWLPRGESLDGGQIASTNAYLTGGPSSSWALTVYVAGRCSPTSQQILRQLRQHRKPELNCTVSSSSGSISQIVSVAPPVDGHLAYWTEDRSSLVWEYARGSWATLSGPRGQVANRDAVKVADHIRYAVATKPSIEFPVQLRGLPPAWRVVAMYFVRDAGVLRASEYSLAGSGPIAPNFTTDPATRRSSCYFYPGQSARQTINGYRVTVNHLKAVRGNPPVQQVCAPDADGLSIFISTYGRHAAPNAISIFARHTRLLGTNPADWTTKPLG
jgi:hypothetical protein